MVGRATPNNGIRQEPLPIATPVPPPASPPTPSFLDYISGGCELDLGVAIDFTSSNRNPTVPGSLHDMDPTKLNEYENAIVSVGRIVSRYDSDKRYSVWGFGAKYENVTRHAFQVGDKPEVEGIRGILDAYKQMFLRGIHMSSPVVLEKVIRAATKKATKEAEDALIEGKQKYNILLILTHGNVSDLTATKAALKEASSAPLSVIIVGIGKNDFRPMQFLDDFQQMEGGRDICNFVEFDSSQDRETLTKATLNEIPGQLVSYFTSRGILPIKLDLKSGSKDEDFAIEEGEHPQDEIEVAYRDRIDMRHSFCDSGRPHIFSAFASQGINRLK
eukprot:CAMPEP_0197233596 /NCGR_PEP_ID=MMETSP1429-20130617/1612_1 /TAXON_ID=49237 /ORGANISM="Chaetoceros  sp., Strain UNC1202" /LENGTH=330 /DNA_ID=CAMNT_0042691861 /DNA_START=14 /DNA_END=1006 /DNA_ORIENTATION=-